MMQTQDLWPHVGHKGVTSKILKGLICHLLGALLLFLVDLGLKINSSPIYCLQKFRLPSFVAEMNQYLFLNLLDSESFRNMFP